MDIPIPGAGVEVTIASLMLSSSEKTNPTIGAREKEYGASTMSKREHHRRSRARSERSESRSSSGSRGDQCGPRRGLSPLPKSPRKSREWSNAAVCGATPCRTRDAKSKLSKERAKRRIASPSSEEEDHKDKQRNRSRDTKDHHRSKRSPTPSNPRPHKQWFAVDRFDGSTPWPPFAERFQFCAKMNGWDEREKAAQLQSSLKGMAAQLLCYGKRREWTYSELFEKLEDRFGNEDRSDEFLAKLETRKRGPKETLQQLCHGIEELVALSYPGPRTSHSDRLAVTSFLRALDDPELAGKVRDKRPQTLDEAFKMAQMFESFRSANAGGNHQDDDRKLEGTPSEGCGSHDGR